MKNARTKHLDFIIGDMVALGLAQFLMVLMNQDKLNPVLYMYYVQLGLLLAIIFATEVICLFSFRLIGLFSRLVLFATFFVGILFMYAERLLTKNYLRRKFRNIKYARTIMVIATEQQAGILIRQLSSRVLTIFKIQGVAVTDRDMKGQMIQGVPVSCSMDGLSEYITGHIIDEILLSIPDDPRQEAELAKQFLSIGMVVHIYMEQFLQDIPRKTLERVSNMNVITCFNREIPMRLLFCKRLLDILGGAVGCVMTLVIGPMIFIQSPGPILFSQTRVGKNGRTFRIYKFRSMVMDADKQKEMLMSRNKIRGNMFKMDDDPRIIPGIGHFIRRTSLDEFPQFFNVLRGDMSLVGTRPPTVDEYEAYSFSHKKRLAMKPGITGLWQISGRSDITDFEEVVELDGRYIDEWDLEMDVKIILRTILVILKRRGSI